MLSKEDKKDVKGAFGKAIANKVHKATDDSRNKKRTVNLIPDHQTSSRGQTNFKRVDSTGVTAKDKLTKGRALRGLSERQEANASGNKEMYNSNRAGYRKTHRARQKSGEASNRNSYMPHRREN
jgi:hypothetical protein